MRLFRANIPLPAESKEPGVARSVHRFVHSARYVLCVIVMRISAHMSVYVRVCVFLLLVLVVVLCILARICLLVACDVCIVHVYMILYVCMSWVAGRSFYPLKQCVFEYKCARDAYLFPFFFFFLSLLVCFCVAIFKSIFFFHCLFSGPVEWLSECS